MNERKIIKAALDSREAFDTIAGQLAPDKDLSEPGRIVWKFICQYYEIDQEAEQVDQSTLIKRVEDKYPKKIEIFIQYFAQLPNEVSIPNLLTDLVELKKKSLASEIISKLSMGQPADHLMQEYLEYDTQKEAALLSGEIFCGVPIKELLTSVAKDNLVPVFPSPLNDILGGGVPRESHILVYGRPDSGKSTFVLNWAAGLCYTGNKVLYVGNEDPYTLMILRLLSRLTGVPKEEIAKDVEHYEKVAEENGYKNFTFASLHPGTATEIRSLVSQVKPDVLVIDQIRNLKASKESSVVNYEEAAKASRSIAKEFGIVVIAVTQAGDSASGHSILDMGDVDGSNTGIPGQMDLMIGIGQTIEMKENNHICLSFPKNKLSAPIKPMTCKVDYVLNKVQGLRIQ